MFSRKLCPIPGWYRNTCSHGYPYPPLSSHYRGTVDRLRGLASPGLDPAGCRQSLAYRILSPCPRRILAVRLFFSYETTATTPMIITILQITQMIWGLCLIGLYATHPTTEYTTASSIAVGYGVIMYSSYLWMFCVFFANKYNLVVPRRLVWILVGVVLSVSWHQQQLTVCH